jgi:hypothetical protein
MTAFGRGMTDEEADEFTGNGTAHAAISTKARR